MNNAPRETLRRIISKYGTDLCADKRRCEALLKDLCGEHRREINVLTNAIEERVPLDLLAAGNQMPRGLLLTKLAKRLEDNLGLTREASEWAVDSWAFALELLTEAEISEKEREQTEIITSPSSKPIQSAPPISPSTAIPESNQNRKIQLPQKPQAKAIPSYPPALGIPVNFPTPIPKLPPQQSGSSVSAPQKLPQSNNQVSNSVPKGRFGKFFGCLFVLFLIVASTLILIFGVPYAIEVMRETQRQNEVPRFPPQ